MVDLASAMHLLHKMRLLRFVVTREGAWNPKKRAVVRRAVLGEVREDLSFRVYVGAYIEDTSDEEEVTTQDKLPHIQFLAGGQATKTHARQKWWCV